MVRHTITRVSAVLMAASVAILLVPGLVSAHSELVSSTPASGATVPSPYTGPIVLTFSEHLATGSKADLVDATGATVASAAVDANAMTMTFTLTTPLACGRLPGQVGQHRRRRRCPPPAHRLVHRRGRRHPHQRAPARRRGLGRAERQRCSDDSPTAAPTPAPSPDTTDTGGGSDVVVPIIVALIVLGAGAAYLLTRRNRPTDTT